MAVAQILTDGRWTPTAWAAALLHDTMEYTGVAKSTLEQRFGSVVAELVDGLSKLERLEYQTKETAQAENFRTWCCEVWRIYCAHHRQAGAPPAQYAHPDAMREDKRRRIAQASHRHLRAGGAPYRPEQGLPRTARPASSTCTRNRYQVLHKAIRAARGNRRELVSKIMQALSQKLVQANIEASIKGREKNLYSIYHKMQEKQLSFS